MARFSNPVGSGEGGDLPQPLATTSSPTFNKITLTSNGATDNITIGDDVILGDGNVANHVVIIGQQDATAGGIVLGTNETEFISTNGTDLSITADNDIVLYPGSNYAYLNVIDEAHRLATMSDITGGSGADTGDFGFAESTMSTDANMSIQVNGVPGNITLSAYNGVELSFAQAEGAGLKFPDDTIQTTAYTGGSVGTGDITFVNNTISSDTGDDIIIQNKDNSDIVKARIVLDQSNEQVLLEAINSSSNTFTTGDWTTATWSQNVIQINGTENGVIPFFNGLNGNVTHIQVNNGEIVRYDGASYGPTDLTMYTITNAPVESDPVTIESLRLIYGVTSKIDINYDNEEFLLQSNGMNLNLSSDQEINLDSSDDIDLSAANRVRIYGDTNVFINSNGGGEYIGTSIDDDFGNQIATINNINAAIETGTPEVSFEVNGGTTATQPTFDGAPLFSGTYVKIGPQVHFQIQVDMDNITSFGTGQYYVDLPFDAKYGYQFKEGCLHDISNSNQYAIGGHVAAGTSRLYLTFTGSNGQDEIFDHDSPVTLAVADNFHISGTYITN